MRPYWIWVALNPVSRSLWESHVKTDRWASRHTEKERHGDRQNDRDREGGEGKGRETGREGGREDDHTVTRNDVCFWNPKALPSNTSPWIRSHLPILPKLCQVQQLGQSIQIYESVEPSSFTPPQLSFRFWVAKILQYIAESCSLLAMLAKVLRWYYFKWKLTNENTCSGIFFFCQSFFGKYKF